MWAGLALAGPPYVTDDPAPTDQGHWEIYAYGNGLDAGGAWSGESGLDMNYGAAKDLQLTLVVPSAYVSGSGGQIGMGTVEAAAKYQFAHQADDGVDLAIFPRAFVPTATAGLGSSRLSVLLPVWAQKDFGDWSLFCGGGWQWNPGPGQHDFWTGGAAITRQISKRLSLGGEIWARTKTSPDGHDFAGLNLGADYRLSEHWSLLASGGPGFIHAADEGRWDFYFALKADY